MLKLTPADPQLADLMEIMTNIGEILSLEEAEVGLGAHHPQVN